MRIMERYLLLDAMYRIQEHLFSLDDQIRKSTYVQLTNARLRANSVWAAAVGGLIAVVPTLLSVSGVDWKEAPALLFYGVVVGMVLLWIFQIVDARKTEKSLGLRERMESNLALQERGDYLLEQVAMYGSRVRVLQQAISEQARETAGVKAGDETAPFPGPRYDRLLAFSLARIQEVCTRSEQLVQAGKRSPAQHHELLEWARPYLPPRE